MSTEEMKLVTTRDFGGLAVDVYENPKREFFMTREQIGTALEYKNPRIAISKIHNSNVDRLDKFSTVSELDTVEGNRTVKREVFCYNMKGVMEICRFSRQPKADKFIDFCWDVMESLMRGETVSMQSAQEAAKQLRTERFQALVDNMSTLQKAMVGMVEQVNTLTEARKQDRQAIDNVLFVCKKLDQDLRSLRTQQIRNESVKSLESKKQIAPPEQSADYIARCKRIPNNSEWRRNMIEMARQIGSLTGAASKEVLKERYNYMTRHYDWDFKSARKKYIEDIGYTGSVSDITQLEVIEFSVMYSDVLKSILKDKLEEAKKAAECKAGIVDGLARKGGLPLIPKEMVEQRATSEAEQVEPTPKIVAEAYAVEIETPEQEKPMKQAHKKANESKTIKEIIDPLATKLGDKTLGSWVTCKKVYEIVGVAKMDRLMRQYCRRHGRGPKTRTALFTDSPKNMKLFEEAANKLAASI